MIPKLASTALLAFALSACAGEPSLVDCDALAVEQKACMDDATLAACRAANELCKESGGDVLILESCPLQFLCSG